MEKETKEKLKIFTVVFFITLIFCLPFLFPHKITDTYWNIGEGISVYKFTPLRDGRIVHFLILTILDMLNISMETYSIGVHYVCVILYAFAIYNVYTYIIKILDSRIQQSKHLNIVKAIILMGSTLIILNPLVVENFAYIDNITMSLGLLLGNIAAKTLHQNQKWAYAKTLILILIAGLCYQGNLNMWIALSLLYFAIDKKKPIKEWVKYFAKIASIIIIVLCSLLLVLNFCNNITGNEQKRLGNSNFSFEKLSFLFTMFCIWPITNMTFGYCPQMLIAIVIIITTIMIGLQKSPTTLRMIFKYIFIVFLTILACIVPTFLQKNITLSARTLNGIGAIIGISIIFLLYVNINSEKLRKPFMYVLLILSIVLTCINLFDYYNIAYMNQITCKKDKEYVDKINAVMLEYEQKNGIILKKVMFFKDKHCEEVYNNFVYNTFNTKGIVTNYARLHWLNYYTGRSLEELPTSNEKYDKYFKDKNWDSFNKEQVQFEGDTVYICAY